MCTSIAMKQAGGLFGRNLDLECGFGQQVAVMPRQYPLQFLRQKSFKEHFAMMGMAHMAGGHPLYAEAVNEKGLYMAGLYFPGSAWYPEEAASGFDAVAPHELIPWVLGRCESLKQARTAVDRLRLVGVPFSKELPVAPLHWHLADATGAMVLESTREGLRLYEDPVGVLTNNPPFPFHRMNLRQYQSLSARMPKNHLAPGLDLSPFGQGFGALGLPGDPSPASRYVRAAFCTLHSPDEGDLLDHVGQFFHLLDAVAMVKGSVVTQSGGYDLTQYSCCWAGGVYYYKTYANSRITAIRMDGVNLDSDEVKVYPLRKDQGILYEN